jgi:glycosyltransferase involved in cell wall biosynthesis
MESSYMAILRGSASPYQKFGNIYRRMVVPRVVKKSSKIITVSHFEKNRIGDFFHLSGDKRLTAVYNGVSTHFKPVTNLTDLQQVKAKYKLPDHFFFFLGNTDPKKNTKGVLKAYADYVKQYGDTYKLVMLDYDLAELSSLLSDLGSPELISNIILTGYVANTDLPAIYSQCAVFLYPSLRESFGIPMLEAMACGVPVITSNTSSMPEVAGDAAILVDPFKPGEITAAIHFLTQESDLRNSLLKKGISRASEFSWLKMAEDVKDIYEEVYKQSYQK